MSLYDLYYPTRIYTSDIPGWYKFEHEYEYPIEGNRNAILALFWDIPLMQYIKENDINIYDAPASIMTVYKTEPINIEAYNKLPIDPYGFASSIHEIEIKLEHLCYQEIIPYAYLSNRCLVRAVKKYVAHEMYEAIEEKEWSDIYIRHDSYSVSGNVMVKKTWRQFMAYHNRIGKVDEKTDINIRLRWSIFLGGYNRKKALVHD